MDMEVHDRSSADTVRFQTAVVFQFSVLEEESLQGNGVTAEGDTESKEAGCQKFCVPIRALHDVLDAPSRFRGQD